MQMPENRYAACLRPRPQASGLQIVELEPSPRQAPDEHAAYGDDQEVRYVQFTAAVN